MSLARSSADFNIISQGVLFAMKKFHAAFLGLITGLLFSPADAAQHQEKEIMLPEMPHGRPRLLLNSTTGFHPLTEARNNRWGNTLADRVVHDAHVLLSEKPVERVMEGRRLLAVSRNVLYRVITLSAAYHLTGERLLAGRAAEEMCTAADFPDWNPSHFLDVAEMTLALAIGYDWLFDTLNETQREKIRSAIVKKGLKPSFQGRHWWITGKNNWNQVCHAGMVAGALAVSDAEPELAERVILRAVRNLPRSMKASFSPNGAYPEGPMYWSYGTEFTVLALAMLEAAFGQDFGLSEIPGFSVTGDFVTATTAPSGLLFNYADCTRKLGASFAMHWLIARFQRPDWFTPHERKVLLQEASLRPANLRNGRNRLLPLSLLYLRDSGKTISSGKTFFYSGDRAAVPMAVIRTGGEKKDAWLGVKGGSPSGPHGHMDGGSFVYEACGVRWASDLGMENYHRIESQGLSLWDGRQESDRWNVFRIGPESHSILRIDGHRQLVGGSAEFRVCAPEQCLLDLTSLYRKDAQKVLRKLELRPDRSLRITDTLTGVKPGAVVSWQLCTETVAAPADGQMLLRSGRKTLLLRKNLPGEWTLVPAQERMHSYDSPNPGAGIVSFDAAVPDEGAVTIVVDFLPCHD